MASKLNFVLRVTDTFEAGDRDDVIMHIGFAEEDEAFDYTMRLASSLMSQDGTEMRTTVDTVRNKRGVLSCCVCRYRTDGTTLGALEWACRMTVEPVISPAKADVVVNDKILV